MAKLLFQISKYDIELLLGRMGYPNGEDDVQEVEDILDRRTISQRTRQGHTLEEQVDRAYDAICEQIYNIYGAIA